eukprot:COSAG02_NODE_1711_length_11223_cov_5.622348_4_plen_249_part_00
MLAAPDSRVGHLCLARGAADAAPSRARPLAGECVAMMRALLAALLALRAGAADPTCSRGILAGSACCPKECGRCGGPNCGTLPGGSANCCTGSIVGHKDSCDNYDPPCVFHKAKPATDCGDYPATLATDRPNVLLIGDSISMPVPYTPGGYGDDARQLLTKLGMRVWHNGGWGSGGQASNTVKGLHCTNSSTPGNWLNVSGTYDVIHFNFGLHECVCLQSASPLDHICSFASRLLLTSTVSALVLQPC